MSIGEFAKAHQSAKAHHPTIGENKRNQDKIPRLLNEETQKIMLINFHGSNQPNIGDMGTFQFSHVLK